MMIQIDEHLLDEKLAALEKIRAWSPRVISKLETAIRTADDYDLFRINPLRYSADKNMSPTEATDLFLHSAKLGLFEMEWHLICPSCAHIVESFSALTHLHGHVTCQACFTDATVSLDDYIQVTFTLSGRVRENIYRRPSQLPVEDYFFKYTMTRGAVVAGNSFEGIMRGFSRLLTYVPGKTTIRAEMDAHPSVFQLTDFTKKPLVTYLVGDQITDEIQHIHVRVIDGQYVSVNRPVMPAEAVTGPFVHRPPQAAFIAQGRVLVEIENCMDEPTPLWIYNLPFDTQAGTSHIEFEPFLSGKKLITTQTFRDLFRSETIHTDEGIGVQDITFLFTDLKGSTAMYDRIGDAQAYYLVRQHFDTLGRVIAHNGGAIVKTIGDAVMATFVNPADAVKAATEMLTEIEAFNKEITEDIILKIGIHRGHSIVVTLNERLDYFGQTVNIAARVQGLADANEIYITDPIYHYLDDRHVLSTYEVTPEQVVVKGVSGTLQVYKIRPS